MSFNDQVNNLSSRGGGFSVFKEGIKTKWLTGDSAVMFRIAPAYNYNDKDAAGNINPYGFVPFRMPDGSLSAWGGIMHLTRYAGHGTGKTAQRKDILSPLTFGEQGATFCPMSVLYTTCARYPEWQYLIEDKKDANKRPIERAAVTRPNEALVMNIVELSGTAMPEIILGLATKSSLDSMLSVHKNGLFCQRANNVSDDMIKANYLCQWACGDVTDPTSGPVVYITKSKDKGEYSSYQVGLAETPQRTIRRYPIEPALLGQRYDLSNMRRILDVKTDEEIVMTLVTLFNGRSPQGHHEYEVLKLAFGQYFKIPDAPAAPAASPTASGVNFSAQGVGFGAPPVPPVNNFGPGPAAGPVGVPATGFPPPAAPVNAFGPGPVNAQPPAAAVPPPPANNFGPQMAQAPAAAPQMAAGVGAAAANAAAGPVGPAPAAPAGVPGAAAPGDPVPAFDKEGFLTTLRKQPAPGVGPVGPGPGPR
jgi:hypothetical protein